MKKTEYIAIINHPMNPAITTMMETVQWNYEAYRLIRHWLCWVKRVSNELNIPYEIVLSHYSKIYNS